MKRVDWMGGLALALCVFAAPATAGGMCDVAPPADVQAVIGGNVATVDVIDEATLPTLDCIYTDTGDLYNSLALRFVTTGRLVATQSQWSTAAAYFAEWGRNGTVVDNLGESAAWIELPAGLLVLVGDRAFHLSVGKGDMTTADVRARLEAFARQVAARM